MCLTGLGIEHNRDLRSLAKLGFCLQLIRMMSEPAQLIAMSQFSHLYMAIMLQSSFVQHLAIDRVIEM